MRTLTRYILGQLFFTTVAITFVLTGITWLIHTLRYIDLIANNSIPVHVFFEMVIYTLPNLFIVLLPISFLISVLFIYNKLATDHELIVMQAAGITHWQLAKPSCLLAIFFTALLYFFTLYLLPFSIRKHEGIAAALTQHSLVSLISIGKFDTFGKRTIYVSDKDSQGNFLGILIYDASQEGKPVIFMAEKGIVLNEEAGQGVLLINGNRQTMDFKTGKPTVLYFDKYNIETQKKLKPNHQTRLRKPYERSIKDLLNPHISFPLAMRLEFLSIAHQRLLTPLYALTFGLLGACFMILGHFNRRGRTKKIFAACLIAVILEVSVLTFLNSLTHLNIMILLSYTSLLLTIFISCLLLSPLADSLFNMTLPWRRP